MERRRGRRRRTTNGTLRFFGLQFTVFIPLMFLMWSNKICEKVSASAERSTDSSIADLLNTSLPDPDFMNSTASNGTDIVFDNKTDVGAISLDDLLSPNISANIGKIEADNIDSEFSTQGAVELTTNRPDNSEIIRNENLTENSTNLPLIATDIKKSKKANSDNSDEPMTTVTNTSEREESNETMPTVMTFSISASSLIDSDLLPVESVDGSKVSAAVQISNGEKMGSPNSTSDFKTTTSIQTTTTTITTNSIKESSVEKFKGKEKQIKTVILTDSSTKPQEAITTDGPLTPTTVTASTTTSSDPTSTTPQSQTTSTISATSEHNNIETMSKSQMELPFEITSMHELREYKRELNQILRRIEKELFLREGYKTKYFTPISTSLPKKISSMFLQKIGAALNVSPKGSDRDELNKRLLSLVALSSASHSAESSPDGPNIESSMLAAAATAASAANNRRFNPLKNHTVDECKRLSQTELVKELKQRGTYNPDLMAWDVSGVLSFLDRSIADQYERQIKSQKSSKQAVQRNVDALERLLAELNLHCNVSTPEVISKLSNLTLTEPRRSIMSPSIRLVDDEFRYKRNVAEDLIHSFNNSHQYDNVAESKKQKIIGEAHVVPFGCDKRGEIEDGYLRLCGACQAIRKLPEDFFPPFINEVTCDEDKACLYFYDYPHGKCKQKHMNFVVLKNMGTPECQIWQKHNLNVRVSCECFVDEMSFFAKYI